MIVAQTAEITDLNMHFEEFSLAVDTKAPLFVHPAQKPALDHHFIVMANDSLHRYKAIRTQKKSIANSVHITIRQGYNREIIHLEATQGPVNSWRKIRTAFTGAEYIGVYCTLKPGVTEAQFVTAITQIEDERIDV